MSTVKHAAYLTLGACALVAAFGAPAANSGAGGASVTVTNLK